MSINVIYLWLKDKDFENDIVFFFKSIERLSMCP